jgi:hypothetical protein
MSYGFRIRKANGAVKIDSDSFGALFADAVVVQPKGGPFSKSYPQQKGMILKCLGDGSTLAISYPGGVPTITINSNLLSVATTFYLFVI